MRLREEPFDKTQEIAKAAAVPFRLTSGATLIACDDAPAFLEACRAASLRVVGAEGFDPIEGGWRPDMRAILDLSGVDDANASVDEARTFVAEVCRDGLLLEFQLASA